MKIHIPIEGASTKPTRFSQLNMLHIVAIMGITLLVGFTLGHNIFLPKTDPKLQAGAVIESTQKTITDETSLGKKNESDLLKTALTDLGDNNFENNFNEAVQDDVITTPEPLPSPESLLRSDDLVFAMANQETILQQLNEAIARTKNDSVALISMFNTNCANWKDECAKPYAATLEINNATYAELVQKMSIEQQELELLRREQSARQQ